MDQAVQALSAGNAVIAVAPGARRLLARLNDGTMPLAVIDGALSPGLCGTLAIDGAAWAGEPAMAAAIRQAMAGRSGAIVPLIRHPIAPQAYAHERAICIDTTAAGGNAALLAAAGSD